MSQVKTLPITARRWFSLLLCAITAATITVFLSKVGFVQKAYLSWSTILNANPILHYSSAFLAGIGIKLLLDKFYISHPKRDIGFSWRYPPVTMSLWLSLIFIGFIFYFTSNQEELIAATSCFEYFIVLILGSSIITAYQQSNERISLNLVVCFSLIAATSTAFIYWHISQIGFSWPLFITVDVYIFSAIFLIIKYINECIKAKWNRNQITLERTKNLSSGDFKTLDEFKSWFKDDSTIKSTEKLEPDLQVYATRITERLKNGGGKYEKDLAQHIALCGPYGCGKSSIVESIVNDLAKNSEKESIWIHSDISTWGAASGNVAHVILSNIIDDISQYIDICAFRALPKHYTEALKSGGSMFQFASTLLAGPVEIEGSFQKLNDVLEVTNHKLLITLQDVDRGTGDEKEKRLNDIAALLDRLKDRNLSHINFIVAMGNENEVAAEVISKATDYREDIIFSDFSVEKIERFILIMIEEAEKKGVVVFNDNMNEFRDAQSKRLSFIANKSLELELISNYLTTLRVLKKVLRRAHEAWTSNDGLMGEVNIYALLMLYTLREREIKAFYRFQHFLDEQNYILMSKQDLKGSLEKIAQNDKNIHHFIIVLLNLIEIDDKYYFDSLKDYLQGINSPKYLRRALKQNVDKIDSDQKFIETFKYITQSKDLLSFVKYWLEAEPFQEKNRIAQFIFWDLESGKLESCLFNSYKNVVGHLYDTPVRRVAFYIASRLTIEPLVDIEQLLLINGNDESLNKSANTHLKVALIEVLTDSYKRKFSEISGKTFESELPEGLYAFTRAAYDAVKSNSDIDHNISIPESNYKNAKKLNEEIEEKNIK